MDLAGKCIVKTSLQVPVKWIQDKSQVQETVIKYGKLKKMPSE